jgi:hypothetical protein
MPTMLTMITMITVDIMSTTSTMKAMENIDSLKDLNTGWALAKEGKESLITTITTLPHPQTPAHSDVDGTE